ncbi:MAG TPA: hypothetical protein VHX65_08295 [Pirellulales bacterium]|nr:hypothetical protein [Pirellulales bacterium]
MTSIQCRLFIDECLPPELIDTYLRPHIALAGIAAETVHCVEKFGPNGKWKDPDIIPELARDRRWVVITADRGKNSSTFDGMRHLCRLHNVTLICISTAVNIRGLSFYGPQLLSHWDAMLCLSDGPRGQQYVLRMDAASKRTLFHATHCPSGYRLDKGRCVQK